MKDVRPNDDWRWQGSTLAAPFRSGDRVLPVGEIVRTMIPVNAFGENIKLPVPNVSACLLHLALRQWDVACSIRERIRPDNGSLHAVATEVMDFCEAIMASVILAFGSLESFANLAIPPDAQFQEKKKRRGIFCVKEKPTIEREFTEMKLGDVLPTVLGFDSPKGTKLWESFKVLKDTRDRIVHFKTSDQVPEVDDEHLWGIWIDEACPNYPEIAYAMIDYIASRMDNPPLWTKQFKEDREHGVNRTNNGALRLPFAGYSKRK